MGALHTEYEIKTVKKLIRADFGGKSRLLLTGVLDLVIQQSKPLVYPRSWVWRDMVKLSGVASPIPIAAQSGDVEIWDYKGTKSETKYITDYVRQLLTYAALYKEKSGELPKRCVLFFVNEKVRDNQLLAVNVDEAIVEAALRWTVDQVKQIRSTTLSFQQSPLSVEGGGLEDRHLPVGQRVTDELKQQCTACGFRFDCPEYCAHLPGGLTHPDVNLINIQKN